MARQFGRGSVRTMPNTQGAGTRSTAQATVVVGALGVVFGDIGTSPIYTVQTTGHPRLQPWRYR